MDMEAKEQIGIRITPKGREVWEELQQYPEADRPREFAKICYRIADELQEQRIRERNADIIE